MTRYSELVSGTENGRPVTPSNWKQLGCAHEEEYNTFRASMQQHYMKVTDEGTLPVFTTSSTDDDSLLWTLYLNSFPASERGYHNCHACRRFIARFGGLVVIDDNGKVRSAVWNAVDAPTAYANGIAAMQDEVELRSTVTGVFYSSEKVWGLPKDGRWTHYSLNNLARFAEKPREDASQAMALRKEEFGMVGRAIADYTPATVATALRVLRSDALYRSEKVLGPVEWFDKLLTARAAVRTAHQRANLLWRAIAAAPVGFAHLRSNMAGTLLDDIQAGSSFEGAAAKFADKMHPLKYQRPQAPPTRGALVDAEKLVAELGIQRSLDRRFAKLHEITMFWQPTGKPAAAVADPYSVFGHIKPKSTPADRASAMSAAYDVPEITSTWTKFARDVLPTTAELQVVLGSQGYSLRAFTTAVHADAPPILQWDEPERRNPVAGYFYHGGSSAAEFGLRVGANAVVGITRDPSHWFGSEGQRDNRAETVTFLLAGGYDVRRSRAGDRAGNALFPETLKSELHRIRSVVEAYSRTASLGVAAPGDAVGLSATGKEMNVHLIATDRSGVQQRYLIDRFE